MADSSRIHERLCARAVGTFANMRLAASFKCVPKRYMVTFLAFVGNFLVSYLQLTLSIAIPEMTTTKSVTHGNETKIIVSEVISLICRTR